MPQPVFTSSEEVLSYLQSRYGSANYKSWQTVRKTFYSYVNYPTGGQSVTTFFGTAIGGVNRQLTNIPKANSVGQNHFLLKSIRTNWFLDDTKIGSYAATDATTFYTDIVNGLFQAGVMEFNISSRSFAQIVKPFLYAPPASGSPNMWSACLQALILAEGTPNTLSSSSCLVPFANLGSRHSNKYLVDPNILIEAEQSFETKISFPSAAGVPTVNATSIVNNTTNPLYLGVLLDGIQYRPVQ